MSSELAALNAQLPEDFDWKTYMLYHPDLQVVGIATEQQAKEHYLKQVRRWRSGPERRWRSGPERMQKSSRWCEISLNCTVFMSHAYCT